MDKVQENPQKKPEELKNNSEKVKIEGNNPTPNVKWSIEDKKTLLKALKKYGHKNIPAISKMLPNMPVQAIKARIRDYIFASEYLYEDELINKWLKCGLYKCGDSPVPQALHFIQLFENHPSFTALKGFDFRAIYNFLYHTTLTESNFPSIPKESRDLIFALLTKIDKKSWPKCQKDLWEYLGRVYNRRNIWKVYKGRKM